MDLQILFDDMMKFYRVIKQEVYARSPYLYERWKAGGFLVDNNVSTYPSLAKVIDILDNNTVEEE
jgi:hypothetical protein